MSFNDNDEPSINIQCWICPICHDDHTYGADCKLQDLYSIIGSHRREIAEANALFVKHSRDYQETIAIQLKEIESLRDYARRCQETMRVRDAKIAKLTEQRDALAHMVYQEGGQPYEFDPDAEVAALEVKK